MPRAVLTVAEVFRRYGDTFRAEVGAALSTAHSRVMTAIEQCRTAALGGHVEQCDHCGHRRVWYNSCRNRHCPTCQSLARATWLERRRADLLPTEYFHVVFTVPPAIAEIAAQNKAVVYGLLFRTVAETLRTIAADPRHLGAELGFFAVLHTWGQTLVHHPHLHCVIPGGGLASDGSGWVACRPGFFLPVRVLSRYFRRVLLAALEDAFESEQLRFAGALQPLSDPRCFAEHLRPARETEWVVYAKRPFAGPEQVLDYLGRYTHRIAISNQRLCSLHDDSVRFRYTDYRRAGASRKKTMTLTATEFIRRMLLHVLPPGFHRIRHYGFLANRNRQQKLTQQQWHRSMKRTPGWRGRRLKASSGRCILRLPGTASPIVYVRRPRPARARRKEALLLALRTFGRPVPLPDVLLELEESDGRRVLRAVEVASGTTRRPRCVPSTRPASACTGCLPVYPGAPAVPPVCSRSVSLRPASASR